MSSCNKRYAILACTLVLGIVGCNSKQTESKKAGDGSMLAPPQQAAPVDPKAGSSDMADPQIKANLASLSVDDRALAEKQKICPVSDEPLGSMGAPRKISVAGHDVFICCEGCEKALTSEPDKYLVKLGLQPAK